MKGVERDHCVLTLCQTQRWSYLSGAMRLYGFGSPSNDAPPYADQTFRAHFSPNCVLNEADC